SDHLFFRQMVGDGGTMVFLPLSSFVLITYVNRCQLCMRREPQRCHRMRNWPPRMCVVARGGDPPLSRLFRCTNIRKDKMKRVQNCSAFRNWLRNQWYSAAAYMASRAISRLVAQDDI